MSETAYSQEERDAVLAVRKELLEKGVPKSKLGEVELIVITMNSKCRVAEAVDKFTTWQEKLLDEYGIDDLWSPSKEEELKDQWHRLAVAGTDDGGRQIMWIHGGGTTVEQEKVCVWSSSLYFLAVHSDLCTLRNGITLVIDVGNAPKVKVGNERKLQVAWQNYPSRPQRICILGVTSYVKRIAINALIAFASLFAKNKVIGRIEFDTVKKMGTIVGEKNLPERHGGAARPGTREWVDKRLADFPRMNLPEMVEAGK